MIPVETVIRKLIVDYEFVILPGFGALLSHQVPANYDKDSGIFSPPDKRLAFNEFLKLDDGLLANYISRHEQISHLEAVAYVKRYIDRLRSVLLLSGQATIQGIGQFSNNVEGKLVFDPNEGKYFKDEWYGFQKVNARLVNSKSTLTTTLSSGTVEEDVEVLDYNGRETARISWYKWVAAASIVGLLCYFSIFFVSSNPEIRSTLNPFPGLFSAKVEKAANETVVIEETVVEPEVKTPVVSDSASTLAPVDSSSTIRLAEKVTVLPTVVKEIKIVAESGKFYVIAGAFKGRKQANVLLAQMKEKGFADAILLPADKISTKVKVAVQSFAVESDAYKASRNLQTVVGEAGWVYKMK